jgi:hypothetical protein
MAKQAPVSLTDPGEYDVILKEVTVERFSPQRGTAAQRICWTLAVDGGVYDKQRIYLNMPLKEELPWSVCKALQAFGVEANGTWSFQTDASGRVTDPKLASGARAHATIAKDSWGKASVRLAPAVARG